MVQLIVTSKIREAIDSALVLPNLPKSLEEEIRSIRNAVEKGRQAQMEDKEDDKVVAISHATVRKLSEYLVSETPDNSMQYQFSQLVAGSRMILKSPKPRTKSPELIQLLQACRIQQENNEYLEMTKDVMATSPSSLSRVMREERKGWKSVFGFFSSLLNVLLSMVAVFVCVYYFSYTVYDNVAMRTLLSLAGAFIVGVAEAWFFSKDWLFDDIAETDPKRRKSSLPSRKAVSR